MKLSLQSTLWIDFKLFELLLFSYHYVLLLQNKISYVNYHFNPPCELISSYFSYFN